MMTQVMWNCLQCPLSWSIVLWRFSIFGQHLAQPQRVFFWSHVITDVWRIVELTFHTYIMSYFYGEGFHLSYMKTRNDPRTDEGTVLCSQISWLLPVRIREHPRVVCQLLRTWTPVAYIQELETNTMQVLVLDVLEVVYILAILPELQGHWQLQVCLVLPIHWVSHRAIDDL